MPPIAELYGVSRAYTLPGPAEPFHALRDVDLTLYRGQLTAVVGSSGSGKSTLLNVLSGIDRPTRGRVSVAGVELTDLDEDGLARFRAGHVGIVFQFFQLLPTLTVLENVVLPMELHGRIARKQQAERARELLARVGVSSQAHKLPTTLSGGQQQRVAIARALANDPALLLADEPTGNLDSTTAEHVLQLLAELTRGGTTVLVATHERDVLKHFDRVLAVADGRIVSDVRSGHPQVAGAMSSSPEGAERCSA